MLGVKPLPGKTIEEHAPKQGRAVQPPVLPEKSKEERDQEVFLEALGSMQKTFIDEWSEEEPVNKAVPRRMKQVERGQIKPEAELDLHGLTVEEACTKLRFFLQDALYQGCRAVLLITGKGLHSSDGPVLRIAMEILLESQRELVLEWGMAPQRYGGSGALIVFLRQSGTLPFLEHYLIWNISLLIRGTNSAQLGYCQLRPAISFAMVLFTSEIFEPIFVLNKLKFSSIISFVFKTLNCL